MKHYNTICGIICIILLIAAATFAVCNTEKPTKEHISEPEIVQEASVIPDEPEPTMATDSTAQPIEPIHEQPYTRYPLTPTERYIVERVVMAESNGETLPGQMAVAQCILNTAEAQGRRPDAVVLTPGQYATPAPAASASVKEAVSAVFDHGVKVTDEPIRYFYAPKHSKGSWHESSLTYVMTIGGHKFFKIPN